MATIHIKLANAVDGGTSPCEGKVRFIQSADTTEATP